MLKLPKPPWLHQSLTGSMASESDGAGQMVTDVLGAPDRKLRKDNSEAEVQTILYANFVKTHHFTHEQTDVIKVATLRREPMTLRQTIRSDRKLVLACGQLHSKLGALY